MTGKKYFAFSGVLLLSIFSYSQNSPKADPLRNNISSAERIALSIIDKLPESSTKAGLKRYYSILAPKSYSRDSELSESNAGVMSFFEKQFQQNNCFAENAFLFYRDIRNSTRNDQVTTDDLKRNRRPSLGDVAGKNRADLPSGWLYRKSLRYSNNSPNAALSLIGLCGHDDKNQGIFRNPKALESLITRDFPEKELQRPSKEDSEIKTLCPSRYSDFYISSALSKEADISDKLKKNIIAIQYPGKNPLQIASKNYHVLGAAFMTCQMIEAGLSPYLAVKVESLAASLYRGIRLCQDLETPALLYQRLQSHRDLMLIPINTNFESLALDIAIEKGRQKSCSIKKVREDVFCELLHSAGLPFDLSNPLLESEARSTLVLYLEKVIAAGLYSSWHVSGQIAGISLPCSKEQFWGPSSFVQWLVSNTNIYLNICGQGLSMQACRRAVKTIKTWEVDFDWTVEQHKAGAEFAAKVCQAYPIDRNSFADFCGFSVKKSK